MVYPSASRVPSVSDSEISCIDFVIFIMATQGVVMLVTLVSYIPIRSELTQIVAFFPILLQLDPTFCLIEAIE